MDEFIDFFSGNVGGIANVYVGQPLDTIKVKMQTFPNLYKNGVECGIKTFQKDGIYRGLYAGTLPALVANMSTSASLFFSYGICQRMIANLTNKKDIIELNTLENSFAGSGAGIIASLVLCPSEVIKCRLQAARELKNSTHIGPLSLTKTVYKESGIRGFYSGINSLLVREVPGYFIFFGSYELSRTIFTPAGKNKEEIGLLRTAVSGGNAGVVSWTFTFPVDVLKSRIQVNPSTPLAKSSVLKALYTIAKDEGVSKLYKGFAITIFRTFFSTGALFVTVEETKKLMKKYLK